MKNEDIRTEASEGEEFIATDPNFETTDADAQSGDMADNVSENENEGADNSAQLADQAREWQDKYIRLSAEFDNYRRRTLKEKMDLISTGGEDVVKSILTVLDDMDRAVEAMEKSDDIESARQGMRLIQQKLVDVLKQKGVCEIVAHGEDLDTDLHEAVAKFPSENQNKGKVLDVVQKGYKMKDKVIRFCKVVVGE